MASKAATPPPAPAATRQSRRGRVACTACNSRRVRCDAWIGRPCSNCAVSGEPCHLIVSKRGKYVRSQTKNRPARWAWPGGMASSDRPTQVAPDTLEANTSGLSSTSFEPAESMTGQEANSGEISWTENASGVEAAEENNETDQKPTEGSEMLYARLSELHLPPSNSRSSNSRRTVYLSESFVLSYIVQEVASPRSDGAVRPSPKLQYRIPPTVDDKARNLGYDTRLEPGVIEFLNWRGALSLPEKSVSDQLIRTYFDCVHPAFPIFDRNEFAALYNANRLSLLTLQGIYLLASTLCEESLLVEAGFADRNAARKAFHNRVKALYDADYETDKIAVITTLLLISFCWNGSMDEKDMWHWLGAAIGLAQTQGMHRSTARSDLCLKDQRLWKRIWWSLYVRDRHSASALGRPMRIRDDDCDVELLEESDIYETEPTDPLLFGEQTKTHVVYAVHQAKLSILLGEILRTKFAIVKSNSSESDKAKLMSQLDQWAKSRPPELTRQRFDDSVDSGFWANTLEMLYNHHLLVLNRPQNTASLQDSSLRTSLSAAKAITRILDDLLENGTLRRAQLHLVPSVFAALTMHIVVIRNSDSIQRKVAENHARLCMLGLSEWAKTWPPCGWLVRLFESLLAHSDTVTGTKSSSTNVSENVSNFHTRDPNVALDAKMVEQPSSQYAWPEKENNGTQRFNVTDQDLSGLFPDFEPQLPMSANNCNGGNGSDDDAQFAQFCFNQSGGYNMGFHPGLNSNLDSSNQAFLSYIMNQIPEL